MTTDEMINMQKEIGFSRQIMDNLPALVYINDFTECGNPYSLRNIWCNSFAQKFIGYSQEEINLMGFSFFTEILHPDDIEIIKTSVDLVSPKSSEKMFTFLQRLKPRGKTEYSWMYGNGVLLDAYESGFPQRSLNVVIEISDKMHTENQLVAALKEISQLKNKLRCQLLTKREKEVLRCIADGLTDIEIGKKLFISFATAKTHRNNIIKKFGLKNTACLVAFAVTCGIC